MANVPSEADRLLDAGRMKIRRSCLMWGGPILWILVVAGLQYAGAIRLEEHFARDPDTIDPQTIWLVLAGFASLAFLCGAIGVLQGWAGVRRARMLQQSASAPERGP